VYPWHPTLSAPQKSSVGWSNLLTRRAVSLDFQFSDPRLDFGQQTGLLGGEFVFFVSAGAIIPH